MSEQRYVMKGPKIFDNAPINPDELGFKIGKPLTEKEFLEVKKNENVKLLHCDSKEDRESLRRKMREKLEKMKEFRVKSKEKN